MGTKKGDMDSEVLKQKCKEITLESFEKYVEKSRAGISPLKFAQNELEIQKIDLEKARKNMLGNFAVFRIHYIDIIEKYIKEKIKPSKNISNSVEPIVWKGTPGQLIYLFEKLHEKGFFPLDINLQSTIKKHFANSNGGIYTNLKQSKQDYLENKSGKPTKSNELDSIVTGVTSEP
jgi:hypothetical protein